MDIISRSVTLQKLNPRELPKDKELPQSFQKFLEKAPKPKNPKIQTSITRSMPKSSNPIKSSTSVTPLAKSKSKTSIDLYRKQLEFSRNYSSYIKEDPGKPRDDIFPDELLEIPKKIPKLQDLKDKSDSERKRPDPEDSRALVSHLIKTKEAKKSRRKMKMQGLLQGPLIWCARCSKEHPQDYHKKKTENKKKVLLPVQKFRDSERDLVKMPKFKEDYEDSDIEEEDDFEEDEEDSFIVSDDEYEKTKHLIRSITGFDPSRYKEIDRLSTKNMESSASQILYEDKVSAKIGSLEDRREEEIERKRLKKKFNH